MPYNYTHYRFGKELLPTLPDPVRQSIGRFRRMYDMGLHGPDLFFYHFPFWKNRQGDLGQLFHLKTGQEFFPAACAAAKSEAAQAYLYGLLAHYCLDSLCHPYIDQLVAIGEVRHIALESELERWLLQKDGIPSPHTYDMSKRLRLTRGECITVAELYPGADAAAIRESIRFMAFAVRFFTGGRRETRQKLLRLVRPGFCDFFLPTEAVEDLHLYVMELTRLYAQARDAYPRLLEQLLEHRKTGEPLGEDFAPAFG